MYRKNCEKCSRSSYSSSEFGEWLCPVCGNDLSHLPFFDAITFEQVHIKTIPIKQKLKAYKEQVITKSQ